MKNLEELGGAIRNNLAKFDKGKRELAEETSKHIDYAIELIENSGLDKREKEKALDSLRNHIKDVKTDPENTTKRLQGDVEWYGHKLISLREDKTVKKEVREEEKLELKEKLSK